MISEFDKAAQRFVQAPHALCGVLAPGKVEERPGTENLEASLPKVPHAAKQ